MLRLVPIHVSRSTSLAALAARWMSGLKVVEVVLPPLQQGRPLPICPKPRNEGLADQTTCHGLMDAAGVGALPDHRAGFSPTGHWLAVSACPPTTPQHCAVAIGEISTPSRAACRGRWLTTGSLSPLVVAYPSHRPMAGCQRRKRIRHGGEMARTTLCDALELGWRCRSNNVSTTQDGAPRHAGWRYSVRTVNTQWRTRTTVRLVNTRAGR
jgi:hypothetical protein